MRNQRGYGTQKNWMAVRQELLYYTKGNPHFNVEATYTDIPKILRGYYKEINGKSWTTLKEVALTQFESGMFGLIFNRFSIEWRRTFLDVMLIKPIKSIDRIIRASSYPHDLVIDFFAHSGIILLASEILKRKCFTIDIDPIYAEITIRRLERFRDSGKLGWQNGNPFESNVPKLDTEPVGSLTAVTSQKTLF